MFYRLWEELEKPGAFAYWETSLRRDPHSQFPEFPQVVLSRDSSPVDFIGGGGFGGQGLLVSEKALRVLQDIKLPPYRHHAVEVAHRGKPLAKRYFWLQILHLDNYGWIDFEKSQFTVKAHLDESEGLGDPLRIGSASELRELIEARKADFWIYYSRITLNSAYAEAAFDLFYLEWLGGLSSSAPLLSERGKSALERGKLVGYRLVERPDIVLDHC